MWAMALKKLTVLLMLVIAISHPATSIKIDFDLECKSNDNRSTMTQYNLLRDSGQDNGGDSRDYEARSSSYLNNGTIRFQDILGYIDSLEKTGDSSVYHSVNFSFDGEKGTSEFSAKGLYPNNQAISSWNRVRYGDLGQSPKVNVSAPWVHVPVQFIESSPPGYIGNWTELKNLSIGSSIIAGHYKPRVMSMNARVELGSILDPCRGFALDYDAMVDLGTVEFGDSMGLMNNVGARRTNWAQTASMKGNITTENTLLARDLV
jgi:hypothetical protein